MLIPWAHHSYSYQRFGACRDYLAMQNSDEVISFSVYVLFFDSFSIQSFVFIFTCGFNALWRPFSFKRHSVLLCLFTERRMKANHIWITNQTCTNFCQATDFKLVLFVLPIVFFLGYHIGFLFGHFLYIYMYIPYELRHYKSKRMRTNKPKEYVWYIGEFSPYRNDSHHAYDRKYLLSYINFIGLFCLHIWRKAVGSFA